MDKPIPWICVLVGIAFFEEGVKEARTKNLAAAFVFFGLALVSFIATILSAEARDVRELIKVPPLFPYALTALIVSVIFGLASEYRRDTRLRIDAQQTAAAIAAFGRLCADRISPTFTNIQRIEEEGWERDEFKTRFHPMIAHLNREFALRGISDPEMTDFLLGTNSPVLFPVIPIIAQTIAALAGNLPRPKQWLRKSLFTTIGFYLGGALILWLVFFRFATWDYHQPLPSVRLPTAEETVGLTQRFEELPKPCRLKISGPRSALKLRDSLIFIDAHKPTGPCEIIDNASDAKDELSDVDLLATAVANPGITVRWRSGFDAGEKFRDEMLSLGSLIVRSGHKLPPNSPPNLIWIEIGNGSPWKDQNPTGFVGENENSN